MIRWLGMHWTEVHDTFIRGAWTFKPFNVCSEVTQSHTFKKVSNNLLPKGMLASEGRASGNN